jgi:hypothetical protein
MTDLKTLYVNMTDKEITDAKSFREKARDKKRYAYEVRLINEQESRGWKKIKAENMRGLNF